MADSLDNMAIVYNMSMLRFEAAWLVVAAGEAAARHTQPNAAATTHSAARSSRQNYCPGDHSVKINYDKKWIFITLVLTVIAVSILLLLTPEKQGESISPRGVYRVEYHYVSLAQKLMHHRMKMPMTVRLYEVKTDRLIAESKVADLWLNGAIHWYLEPPMNSIMVGNDVIFEDIPRECSDCPRLTFEQMTN